MMLSAIGYWGAVVGYLMSGLGISGIGYMEARPAGDAPEVPVAVCSADPPTYYKISLVSTKRLPGTRLARGAANVTFAPSPYGIHISPKGTYVYDLSIKIDGLAPPAEGVYIVWLTTPDLKEVKRVGQLDASGSIEGRVDWNKFLVVVTLEEADDPDQPRWSGPIAFRGLSRSGFMHTMAGHGPFNQEPCAFYGYE